MGNKNVTVYMVNNEMELICSNIALGNESYNLEKENRELIKKISEVEENIIDKISMANIKKDFTSILLVLRRRGFIYGSCKKDKRRETKR